MSGLQTEAGIAVLDDAGFDRAFVRAVFVQAALIGWAEVNLVEAAQEAGLDVARARSRFPSRGAVLLRFGAQADQAALAAAGSAEPPRERLFDLLMNRFEALQQHRDGVIALMAALRTDPATSVLLYGATLRSMKWLLEAAGVPSTGVTGALRVHGLMALWLFALRAWERDDSPDLSGTMRAVDLGLDRAMQAERSLPGRRPDPPPEAEPPIVAEAEPPIVAEAEPPIADDITGSAPTIV